MTNLTPEELNTAVKRIARKPLFDFSLDDHLEMQSVIAQQDARIKELEAVLVKAGEALHNWISVCPSQWYDTRTAKRTNEPKPVADAREALASINTVLGRE